MMDGLDCVYNQLGTNHISLLHRQGHDDNYDNFILLFLYIE